MSKDSEIALMGRDMKEIRRRKRAQYGKECPRCREQRPRAHPTILLPGQRCFDGYRDPRSKLTDEQHDALWAELGYTRVEGPQK